MLQDEMSVPLWQASRPAHSISPRWGRPRVGMPWLRRVIGQYSQDKGEGRRLLRPGENFISILEDPIQ